MARLLLGMLCLPLVVCACAFAPAPAAYAQAPSAVTDQGVPGDPGAAAPQGDADVDEGDWDIEATPWVPPGQAVPPGQPVPPAAVPLPVPTGSTVKGRVAMVRADGRAAVPRGAPKRVRSAIAAANQIIGKPYKWGGGHGRLQDSGYDCSGSVSYSLVKATLLGGPMVSGALAHWANAGAGRWISVYANKGHVYMEIAGLRLDTSPVGDPIGRMGVRWRPLIGRRPGFSARHPLGL